MTDQALRSQLNRDMYFGIRRREQLAWIVAIIAGLAALLLAAAILVMMPLKTTQAYLGLVDRQSGDVIRAYEVGRATLTERDAVIESWVYNYVLDRETHDIHDQQQRLERVISRSVGTARDDLLDLWNPRSSRYIRKLISRDARVFVSINAITLLSENTAQVRLQKRIVDGTREGTSNYIVTLSWRFKPANTASDRMIWENPFGFQVTDYRIDHQSEG